VNATPVSLEVDLILRANTACTSLFGGMGGVRDLKALQGCLTAHMASAGGEWAYPSVEEQAFVMMREILALHPFMDGNKRVALVVPQVYLWSFGLEWAVMANHKYSFVMSVINEVWDHTYRIIDTVEVGPRPIGDPDIIGATIDPEVAEMTNILVADRWALERLSRMEV
jgi:death-on-curing protein